MVDPIIVFAFIEVESGFNAKAYLSDRNGGSYGLMQLNLSTAKDRGYTGNAPGLYNPEVNVMYGVKILGWISDNLRRKGLYSVANVAAAYNSGLNHVLTGGSDASYSAKIEAAYVKWQRIFNPKQS